MRYTATFEAQPDGGYHASCPSLPGCHSEGDTLEESVANIREAIAVYLESLQVHGEPLPVETLCSIANAAAMPSIIAYPMAAA